jgi:hypothetical protein
MTHVAAATVTRESGASCGHILATLGIVHRSVSDGAMTNGSTNLDSATAAWVALTDVGRSVVVDDAGPSGGPLIATILSRTSATRVVLSVAASATVSGKLVQVAAYRETTDAAITSGQAILTSATAAFNGDANDPNTDIGRRVAVQGAGAAGAVLAANILSVQSPTQATLSVNASTTVSAQTLRIARTYRGRVNIAEFSEAVTGDEIAALLKIWGKLAVMDSKTLGQMEGQTVMAAVP